MWVFEQGINRERNNFGSTFLVANVRIPNGVAVIMLGTNFWATCTLFRANRPSPRDKDWNDMLTGLSNPKILLFVAFDGRCCCHRCHLADAEKKQRFAALRWLEHWCVPDRRITVDWFLRLKRFFWLMTHLIGSCVLRGLTRTRMSRRLGRYYKYCSLVHVLVHKKGSVKFCQVPFRLITTFSFFQKTNIRIVHHGTLSTTRTGRRWSEGSKTRGISPSKSC